MKSLLVSLVLGLCAFHAGAWGQKGHDVTATIAQRHLSAAASAAVDSIFRGRSMVYWSNWLDNASHTPDYAYSLTWHYRNIDEGVDYSAAPLNPQGDVVDALTRQTKALRSGALTPDESELALKMIVHLMADLHQPMHIGHATDLGGNKVDVKWFGSDSDLHTVWDTDLPEAAHRWSHTEWADEIDREPMFDPKAESEGWFDDWARQTWAIATEVYAAHPAGSTLSYDEVARWTPVVESQFYRGGLRLAKVLNFIFQ